MSVIARSIFLEVPEYNFEDESKGAFIGRLTERERIKRKITPPCLTKNEANLEDARYQGSYLVAGYRGIGKSTLVRKVYEKVDKELKDSKEKRKLYAINVYLSQGDLSDFDLLRQMFIQLRSEIEDDLGSSISWHKPFIAGLAGLFMAWSFGVTFWGFGFPKILVTYPTFIRENPTLSTIILIALFFLTYGLSDRLLTGIYEFIIPKRASKRKLKRRLEQTNRRIHSGLEVSDVNTANEDNGIETSFINKLLSSFNSSNDKLYKQSYTRITVKELEFELKEILRSYRDLGKGYVLFIIDELDKLEPEFSYEAENIIELGKSKVQTRRDSVAKLLANLKSFIHTADAKFVFIGGAEMYDASLADVADRESFYSSIFHEVIYINSFFKDWVESKKGLSQMTEDYIIRNLIVNKKTSDSNEQLEIDDYYERLEKISERDRFFVIYQLRRFIIFLTYRSNGSPKRLKELFESYLHQAYPAFLKNAENKEKIILHFDESEYLKDDEPNLLVKDNNGKSRTYLRLDYIEQYHVGFLYNIVTPYLLGNQKHFKVFNDRNLYLSAFLLDHILKFHRSAFSWRELELMPDIILGSKGPNLREMMGSIITYLSERHFIRETTNAMFQYKFRSRAAMEFRYISKISDENAAAFNFTYDESYHLKTFFKQKLKQKRLATSSENSADPNLGITISYLNATIADLHFYDEEYESAIRYYNDSFEPLNNIRKDLNNDEKVKFLTNRLMISLCLEKTYRYGNTYSTLRDTIIQIYKWRFDVFEDENRLNQYPWEAPYKRMQLFLRPHLALLAAIEKGRSDGITESNLRRNIQEYCEFMGLRNLFPLESFKPNLGYRDFFHDSNRLGDHKRVQTLLADYYQNIGSILFYKNRNFNSIHQKGAYGVWFEFLKIKNLEKLGRPMNLPKKIKEGRPADFTIVDLNNKRIEVWGLRYASINSIRKKFTINHRYFFPSYSCTFYYTTAIGHILSPYRENLFTIFSQDTDFKPYDSGTIENGKESPIESEQVVLRRYAPSSYASNGFITPFSSSSSALKSFKTIEHLLFHHRSIHILSGKTAQSLGLVLSKLSDGVLASLGNRADFYEQIKYLNKKDFTNKTKYLKNDTQYWFKFWGLHKECTDLKHIIFSEFFGITNVFYMNILSFRAFQQAGLYNDALFLLKKNLYILNTYCLDLIRKNKQVDQGNMAFVMSFKDWLVDQSNILIGTHIGKEVKTERDFINSISDSELTGHTKSSRLFSIDDEEIGYLASQIEVNISNNSATLTRKITKIEDSFNFIDNIYTRIQELRYNGYIRYKQLEVLIAPFAKPVNSNVVIQPISKVHFRHNGNGETYLRFNFSNGTKVFEIEQAYFLKLIGEIHRCYKNLLNITNTYGVSYIMTYTDLASQYRNIYKMSLFIKRFEKNLRTLTNHNNKEDIDKLFTELVEKDSWSFTNDVYFANQAFDNFTKSINLHSEGIEYKSMIKNMYILEDDFNDLLVHFCASLERSLVNTGVIEEKMKSLQCG